ncbi:PREDICTED: uncharacterized protein LOC105965456 isoform X2 [Erythranthe guttata]|uniref:uncharacterized protein LOC105965456 isoform X2 n=1 Tax=Erythranthe guttata TaxID=4155 RepID=UPI00064D9415|nr:PREDICTED: uncharacterized protein LOC105965456 isoform X2 [Erythranthe guttata]|eukprot:XP_012845450.1 PREDICTED: uncharacterized protein LOC105965456 isoform X2 [Erythranthe guttata]
MWLEDSSCFDTVSTAWKISCRGSPHYQIHSKIKNDLLPIVTNKATSHWTSQLACALKAGKHISQQWSKPPVGWYKINSDCSFINGTASAAFIIRNFNGSIVYAHSSMYHCHDSTMAESFAIRDACSFIKRANIKNAIFEADCLNAILYINDDTPQSHWPSSPLIDEIKRYWSLWPKWKFKFCPRNSNLSAHNLARWAFNLNWNGVVSSSFIPISCFCDIGYPLVDSFIHD